jgi:hypothetical protein
LWGADLDNFLKVLDEVEETELEDFKKGNKNKKKGKPKLKQPKKRPKKRQRKKKKNPKKKKKPKSPIQTEMDKTTTESSF